MNKSIKNMLVCAALIVCSLPCYADFNSDGSYPKAKHRAKKSSSAAGSASDSFDLNSLLNGSSKTGSSSASANKKYSVSKSYAASTPDSYVVSVSKKDLEDIKAKVSGLGGLSGTGDSLVSPELLNKLSSVGSDSGFDASKLFRKLSNGDIVLADPQGLSVPDRDKLQKILKDINSIKDYYNADNYFNASSSGKSASGSRSNSSASQFSTGNIFSDDHSKIQSRLKSGQ